MSLDARRSAPAALRNRDPILDVLRDVLPASGLVLELASGSGEHAAHFSRALPALDWQPSDPSADARASIAAWSKGHGNILAPLDLDAASPDWPIACADALLCVNMIHISPWNATVGLMRGAARVLAPGAPLILYGPYRRAGAPTAPSNEAFDADLKQRDPRWGLRDLEAVTDLAITQGLGRERVVEMPANNLTVVFRRT